MRILAQGKALLLATRGNYRFRNDYRGPRREAKFRLNHSDGRKWRHRIGPATGPPPPGTPGSLG